MILSVKFQAMVFLAAFASGAGFAMCYDVLRLFRIYAAHRPITIQIEDMIYWLVCSFVFFNMLLEINNGEMRFYIPFGFFCGMALFVLDELLTVAEEQGDAPDTRQRDNGIDHAADGSALAAESPCHNVELKQSDAAPVDSADNHEDKRQSVQHVFHSSFLPGNSHRGLRNPSALGRAAKLV